MLTSLANESTIRRLLPSTVQAIATESKSQQASQCSPPSVSKTKLKTRSINKTISLRKKKIYHSPLDTCIEKKILSIGTQSTLQEISRINILM